MSKVPVEPFKQGNTNPNTESIFDKVKKKDMESFQQRTQATINRLTGRDEVPRSVSPRNTGPPKPVDSYRQHFTQSGVKKVVSQFIQPSTNTQGNPRVQVSQQYHRQKTNEGSFDGGNGGGGGGFERSPNRGPPRMNESIPFNPRQSSPRKQPTSDFPEYIPSPIRQQQQSRTPSPKYQPRGSRDSQSNYRSSSNDRYNSGSPYGGGRRSQEQYDYLESPYEQNFTSEEVKMLKMKFRKFSYEGKMDEPRFLACLNLSELENTSLGARIYDCVKNMMTKNTSSHLKNYIDYHKYMKASSILAKGDYKDRAKLIYGIFDPKRTRQIPRKDLYQFLYGLFVVFSRIQFDSQNMNLLKEKVTQIEKNEVQKILSEIIDDIYYQYANNGPILSQEQWEKWFMSQEGMYEVVNQKLSNSFF